MAVLQSPPLGLHTFLPLTLPVSQNHRELEECDSFFKGKNEGESSDGELERLIKPSGIEQNAIIRASSLQNSSRKTLL